MLTPQGVRLMLRKTPEVEVTGVSVAVQVVELTEDPHQFMISDGESFVKGQLLVDNSINGQTETTSPSVSSIDLYCLLQVNAFVVKAQQNTKTAKREKWIVLNGATPFSGSSSVGYVIGTPKHYDIVQRHAPIPMIQQCQCRQNKKNRKRFPGLAFLSNRSNGATNLCQQHSSSPSTAVLPTASSPSPP